MEIMPIKPLDIFVVGSKVDYSKLRVKLDKEKFTLPFMPEHIHYSGCQNIIYNGGLFTPCGKKILQKGICKTCKDFRYGTLYNRLNGQFSHKVVSFNTFISKKKYSIKELQTFLECYKLDFIQLPRIRERSPSTESDLECYDETIELTPEQYVSLNIKKKAFKQGQFIYNEDGEVLGKMDSDGELLNIES